MSEKAMKNQVMKTKSHRAKRAMELKAPKVIENTKQTLILRGGKTSSTVVSFLKDLYALKKPHAIMYQRKNLIRPFEDEQDFEWHCMRNDTSLFVFGSNTKKRPNNITIGRMFDYHILDMFEMRLENSKPLSSFKVDKIPFETKPCIVFAGELFESDETLKRFKNVLLDLFRGPASIDNVHLQGLQFLIQFTATQSDKVLMRSYKVSLKKSGTHFPKIELTDHGPHADFCLLPRNKMASKDLYKHACEIPKHIKNASVKNISTDNFGTRLGRIHMQHQDLTQLGTRKRKALSNTKKDAGKTKQAKVAESAESE